MVVIFIKDKNTIEVQFEMIDRPARIRASNAVRRWELLALEEKTEHLLPELIDELQSTLKLNLTPDGVAELAEKYFDEDNDTNTVGVALHRSNPKFQHLSLTKFVRTETDLRLHVLSLNFDIIDASSIKFRVVIFVHNE